MSLTGSAYYLLVLADVRCCRFVSSLRGHVAAVYRVAWSADSRMLVSASKDSTLKVSIVQDFSEYLIVCVDSRPSCGI